MANFNRPSHRLYFDGDETKFELWEMKYIGYLRLHKLSDVVALQAGSDVPDDAVHNADVFAKLIQCLDDRSLTLVMRDAIDD